MKKTVLYLSFYLFFSLSLSAQSKNKQRFTKEKIEMDSLGIPFNGMQCYFPISMFVTTGGRNLKLSQYLNRWYSGMLFSMKEPILYQTVSKKEVYRFTWLRRFRNPVAVRIEKDKDKIYLYVKTTDGAGGSYPGKLIKNEVKELDSEQWNSFMEKLSRFNFWKQPVEEVKELDGENSEWILEGSTFFSYHFVTRTSPLQINQKSFRECCLFLLTLAGIENSDVKK
ncbi:MAG: hypothetical protein ACHQK8_04945 [Bacteroidia bacterium]